MLKTGSRSHVKLFHLIHHPAAATYILLFEKKINTMETIMFSRSKIPSFETAAAVAQGHRSFRASCPSQRSKKLERSVVELEIIGWWYQSVQPFVYSSASYTFSYFSLSVDSSRCSCAAGPHLYRLTKSMYKWIRLGYPFPLWVVTSWSEIFTITTPITFWKVF